MGDYQSTTRREALALLGGAMLAGSATGGASARTTAAQNRTVRAYVGSYHWGYFLLDQNGEELDQLTLSTGDELRLTAFNVESDAAIQNLPGPVRGSLPTVDERARRNSESIPVPQGVDLEDLHEAAEAAYPDHSLAIVSDSFLLGATGGRRGPGGGQGPGRGQGPDATGPGQGGGGGWGGHHGPGHHGGIGGPGVGGHHGGWMGGDFAGFLAPPTYLWHHSTVPSEVGFVVADAGSYGFACTVYCGYGHPYMAESSRVVVEE